MSTILKTVNYYEPSGVNIQELLSHDYIFGNPQDDYPVLNYDDIFSKIEDFEHEILNTTPTYIFSFAELAARRIASSYNKNMIITITGDPGDGKSNAAMCLADAVSEWLTYLKGGTKEKYFTLDNLATISGDENYQLIKNMKHDNIYIIDDASPAMDARSSMTKQNQDISHVLETCRPNHNLIIITATHLKRVDVNLIRLARYSCFTSEIHHDKGFTFLKVFRVLRDQRMNKIYFKYPQVGRYRCMRFLSRHVDYKMGEDYERRRNENAHELQSANPYARKIRDTGPTKTEIRRQEMVTQYGDQVLEMRVKYDLSAFQISKKLGISKHHIINIAHDMGVPFIKFNKT